MSVTKAVAVSALAIAVGLAVSPSAAATFPGASGELMYSWSDVSGKVLYSSSGVSAFDTRLAATRPLFTCAWDGDADGEDDDCTSGEAAVSADGERVTVVVRDYLRGDGMSSTPRLALVGPRTDETRSLSLEEHASAPAWSPDGEKILITSHAGWNGGSGTGTSRLAMIDVETGHSTPIASDGASDADWSVNGEIVYVRDGDLWTTTLDGPELRLTTDGGVAPSWSSDGRRLVFVRDGRIWTKDDAREQQLSDVNAEAPAWSPDGRHIAFLLAPEDHRRYPSELWLMRADGRCAHMVRRAGPWGSYGPPFWRPLTDPRAPRLRNLVCGKEARPDLRPGKRRIRVNGQGFRYRLRAAPHLEGWAALRTRVKALAPTRKGVRRRHLRFSQRVWGGPTKRRFEVGPRGVVTLTVRLSRRQRRILRFNRRLALRVTVAIRDDTGNPVTGHKRLTLLAPRTLRR